MKFTINFRVTVKLMGYVLAVALSNCQPIATDYHWIFLVTSGRWQRGLGGLERL